MTKSRPDKPRWARVPIRVRRVVRRHWRRALRIRERFRFSEEVVHLLFAAVVGAIGGLVNLAFSRGTDSLTWLFLRHEGDPVEVAELLPPEQRVVVTTVGALVAGLILYLGLRFAPKRGGNLLEAVAVGDGRLSFRAGLVKTFSSLFSVVSGGSIGREGAITQLSAMLASQLGQLSTPLPYRLRLLTACGAAAGIAAPYNAPIGGAVFAAMIVLGNFSATSFGPLVLASAVACVVSRGFFGMEPLYQIPAIEVTPVFVLPLFVVVGLFSGALGALFMKSLLGAEALFAKIRLPFFLRMALGGLLVGVIAIQFPEVWGNGYVAANRILDGHYVVLALLGLFFAKAIATLLTVGSGAVGGVFTPTLFLGTAAGSLFGTVLHHFGFLESLPTAAFALVGMGSMLSATTQSPFLAVIMIFEISLNYSLMPAVMLGCVVSAVVSRRIHPRSIYAETQRLRDVAVARAASSASAMERSVGDLMRAPIPPVEEKEPLRGIAKRFLSSSNNFLPVVDEQHRLTGVVALQDLKEFLQTGDEYPAVIAYDVMRPPPPCLTPDLLLSDALARVLESELRNIPVVNSLSEMRLLGSVQRTELLSLYADAVARAGYQGGR
ncbi:MAG: ClcB-like voltage-gated chloride channel protein [Candidatus Eisenbacteria bacterium]